ncbi:hypothetical protein D3C80_517180 [compost metagenome]
MLQLAQGIGDAEGVGHHHQAGFMAEFRDHGRRSAAAVDDDPRMLTDAADGGTGDGQLIGRHRLADLAYQLLGHRHGTPIAAQQQAVLLERGEVLANGHFGGGEGLGQLVDAHLALLVEQREDGMAALGRIAFRHQRKFRFER